MVNFEGELTPLEVFKKHRYGSFENGWYDIPEGYWLIRYEDGDALYLYVTESGLVQFLTEEQASAKQEKEGLMLVWDANDRWLDEYEYEAELDDC